MKHFPYLCFTRLLRDASREGLGRYASALASAVAAWEGVGAAAVRFRPSDPLQSWCAPVEAGAREKEWRGIACYIATGDVVGKWNVFLHRVGAPSVLGSLFANSPDKPLGEAAYLRDYGDHLIENDIADTAYNIHEPGQVRGFASGILLETRLEALSRKISRPPEILAAEPTRALRQMGLIPDCSLKDIRAIDLSPLFLSGSCAPFRRAHPERPGIRATLETSGFIQLSECDFISFQPEGDQHRLNQVASYPGPRRVCSIVL